MKIASIDIGTNSIKSKIFDTTPTSITFLEGIRTPIRLGTRVFNTGELSEKKIIELIKVLKKYQPILQTSPVTHIMVEHLMHTGRYIGVPLQMDLV